MIDYARKNVLFLVLEYANFYINKKKIAGTTYISRMIPIECFLL